MKRSMLALLLLTLTLSGCIFDPGYRGGGYREHGEYHQDRESRGNWGR